MFARHYGTGTSSPTSAHEGGPHVTASVDQIADRIYRISTFVPDIGPTGFTFNQFLVDAEEPLLYHTGMRQLFPLVSEAIETVHAGRAPALDRVLPPRGRRVRGRRRVPRLPRRTPRSPTAPSA